MVLAQGNKDQNQYYPPHVFETHFKLASDWLKDELAKLYPTSQTVIDLLEPYMIPELLQVVNGAATLPDSKKYRNLLGFAFFVTDKKKCTPMAGSEFSFIDPANPTADEIAALNARMQDDSKTIDMTSVADWEYYKAHPYKKPKFDSAKGCFFGGGIVKFAPLGIPFVECRYIKIVPEYKYGYQMQPDETYVFDPNTTVEEPWTEVAIPYLFKAVNVLYANYCKDDSYRASALDLRDNSLF
jgi:hypothetical protein